MIREHRKFILDIREHVHLRDFGKSWRITYNPTTLNSCQEWLSGTEEGIQYMCGGTCAFQEGACSNRRKVSSVCQENQISRFIIESARKYSPNVESLKDQGTGGTGKPLRQNLTSLYSNVLMLCYFCCSLEQVPQQSHRKDLRCPFQNMKRGGGAK